MKKLPLFTAALTASLLFAGAANAACVTKYAKATADTEKNTKWYVLETIVQAVDWGAWPGFVANGKPTGYTIKDERYICQPAGGQVTCKGQATLCSTK